MTAPCPVGPGCPVCAAPEPPEGRSVRMLRPRWPWMPRALVAALDDELGRVWDVPGERRWLRPNPPYRAQLADKLECLANGGRRHDDA